MGTDEGAANDASMVLEHHRLRFLATMVIVLILAFLLEIPASLLLTGNWSISGGVGVLWGLTVAVWTVGVLHLYTPRAYPNLSGCASLSQKTLQSDPSDPRGYYFRQEPLWDPHQERTPHSLAPDSRGGELDFSGKPIDPNVVTCVYSKTEYLLPPELWGLYPVVSAFYKKRGKEFEANDEVAVVTSISRSRVGLPTEAITIGMAKGRLVDEYTTSQNPEMDYSDMTWHRLDKVGIRTVRQFFAHGQGPSGNDGWLPDYPVGTSNRLPNLDERRPALRLAAHLVLLLPSDGTTSWSERRFLLQTRGSRTATGEGGVTSTAGGGMKFWQAWSSEPPPSRILTRRPLTDFVLRELSNEVGILEESLAKLTLVAFTRDLERLGQPTAVLLGELGPVHAGTLPWIYSLTENLQKRRHWKGFRVRLRAAFDPEPTGSEYWEVKSIVSHRVGDIETLLHDPRLEGGTKACLFFLQKLGEEGWNRVPEWVPNHGRAE